MPRDPRAWLLDILAACDLLGDFIQGKTFDDYAADPLLRSGVERQLEIIGEALRVAVQHRPDLATKITDVSAIIAFRNQLTHAVQRHRPSHRVGCARAASTGTSIRS